MIASLSGLGSGGPDDNDGQANRVVSDSTGVRRLTPRECERLQGLPDDWTLTGTDTRRYSSLGDAVTANVSEWIGLRLAAA